MKKLRKKLAGILILLLLANGLVWLLILLSAKFYPLILGLAAISYGFGLRHAVDADHIAAIDGTVRKLMQEGKRPVGVGFFFSLGHSMVVIGLCALIIISTSFVQSNLPAFKHTGSLIGLIISASFLIIIGIVNLITFKQTLTALRKKRQQVSDAQTPEQLMGSKGIVTKILRPLLKIVTSSWQMFFVGFLFGLGFDTASEIGLLSISAVTASTGIPVLTVLLLPLAFTAGMTLVDSLDGILMLGAYGWALVNPDRKLYYNMVITFLSAIFALVIGGIEIWQIIA